MNKHKYCEACKSHTMPIIKDGKRFRVCYACYAPKYYFIEVVKR